jgi:hypothetical protein
MKVPASANQNNGNFMQKRISNSGREPGEESSKTSRFAMNYAAKEDQNGAAQTLPNIKLNSDNYGQNSSKE